MTGTLLPADWHVKHPGPEGGECLIVAKYVKLLTTAIAPDNLLNLTTFPSPSLTLYGEGPEPATVRFRSTKRMNSSASAIRVFQSAPPPTRVAYARS